ncbi:hypothetical protein SLS56_006633 [Neofusicoccum ribis]|uniref:DNA (cytosine-5-)-methyltransferase n=1 Tax=Neofusicoccum ribis TaxID=45134 RepID=A0ABR3SQY0_9PEZI
MTPRTTGFEIVDDYDLISISDDEDNEIPLDHVALNPAIEDFIIVKDEDDDEDEDECSSSQRSSPPASQPTAARPITRNLPPRLPKVYVNSCQLSSEKAAELGPTAQTLKVGDAVELQGTTEPLGIQPGDFLRVLKIIEDMQTGEVSLRGLRFRRNKYLQPMLPKKLNEVHLVVSIDSGDPRPWFQQGMEEIPLACAVRKRRLIVTDLPFPLLSYRDTMFYDSSAPDAKRIERQISASEVLVCRNLFACIYADGERDRARNRPYQGMLRFICLEEADNAGGILTGKQTTNVDLTTNGEEETVVLERGRNSRPYKQRQYTYGDSFMGAGGASCAAKLSGLKVIWGFDHNAQAVATSRMNFRYARIFEMEAFDFPPRGFNPQVDVLHISPPCQPFSSARNHIDYAANDDKNTAALFSVGEIIRAAKPRLVTLEETFGLLTHEKHHLFFQSLLYMINKEGYSVRWAILNLKEYGLPQPRKRLIFIAAAPGVPLPDIPKPMHGGPGSGLLPFVTARNAVGRLPINVTHHNPLLAKRVDKHPWDPDQPLRHTVLTSNSGCYHWSGDRAFTNRELATLQGFPTTYDFFGSRTDIEKQIGNAVPPLCFKLVFEECIKVLRKLDRQENRRRVVSRSLSPGPPSSSQRSGSSSDEPIIVDDEENFIIID